MIKDVKDHTKGYVKAGIYYEDELFLRKDQDIQIEADHKTFFDHCLVNEKDQFIKNSTALVYALRLISYNKTVMNEATMRCNIIALINY